MRNLPFLFLLLILLTVGLIQWKRPNAVSNTILGRYAEASSLQDQSLTEQKKGALLEKLKQIYETSDLEIRYYQARTSPGDTASGREIERTSEEITIDTTPCSKEKSLLTFHKEYERDDVNDITCRDGKKYPRIQIIQK